jgi:phosphoglycerol transferase MdoB-like AlkP superfamily enzyme
MIGYLMALPILLALLVARIPERMRHGLAKLIQILNQVLFSIATLICIANMLIYTEWQTMLNQRAMDLLRNPIGLYDSLGLFGLVGILASIGFLSWLVSEIYRRCIKNVPIKTVKIGGLGLLAIILFPLLALMIRGGLGAMPISESAVYFSKHTFLNHGATNPVWHFVHTLIERRATTNHYQAMPDALAKSRLESLLQSQSMVDTTVLLSQVNRPNIILVMMESHTAQVTEFFGGQAGISLYLDSLARHAYTFGQIYSTGYRTDQGLTSLLSGYPSQPDQSVILHQDKASKLPSLPAVFESNGYQTLFLHGGELNFANMGAYVRTMQFDQVVSEPDFDRSVSRQNWGLPDHLVFDRALECFSTAQAPFFGMIQTLSLHLPYDVPHGAASSDANQSEKFIAAARYADWSIGRFMASAGSMPWFENTIFVFIADHGHGLPGYLGNEMPMARKVPLIFYGSALSTRLVGARNESLGNNHDLAQTLISGLNLKNNTQFEWSRNLLNKQTKPFAMYCNETGLGWLTKSGTGHYRFTDGDWSAPQAELIDSSAQTDARAYLQLLYQDFLDLDR